MHTVDKKELLSILREKKIQVTPQRLAILEQLKLRKDHPSAEMIFHCLKDEFPSLTLVTVYNTLQKLEHSGLCMKVNPLHTSARYDGNVSDHQHAICINCQKIVDIHDGSVLIELPDWFKDIFKVLQESVSLYGLCKECQELAGEDGSLLH